MKDSKSFKLAGILLLVLIGAVLYQLFTFGWIDGNPLYIEKSVTNQQRERGLSGRERLCSNCAMVFLFDDEEQRGFWMKDMEIDIDILWLRDGEVVHIEENTSHLTPEVVYKPDKLADAVLELPAGSVQRWGLKEGSRLHML